MSETAASLSVGADGTIVHVSLWRLYRLVYSRSETFMRLPIFALASDAFFEVAVGGRVPSYSQTIGVENAVSRISFVFCSDFIGQMGDKAR